MSFDVRAAAIDCLLLAVTLAACGERAAPVDSGHAPAAPATVLVRRADRSLARDFPVREGVAIVLGARVPAGWTSRVQNVAACEGSCPDSGYWFGPPLAGDLTGVAAHPAQGGRIAIIQGAVDGRVPFDSVLARFVARLGAPSSDARAPGGDARVTWQDSATTVELTGTPGTSSRSWFIITDDPRARDAASTPAPRRKP
ncbi:MAG: hypothetical protein ACYC4J_13545 [Gemmatimonadaceae bacterium]